MEEKKNIIAETGIELTEEDLEGIVGGIGKNMNENGIICPQCERFFSVSMYQIMSRSSLFCPSCGLQMDIPRRESESLISRLQSLEK